MSSCPAELEATPPFDKGDVVIRSSDDMDFLMYKLDLSRASSVFETMFSLPQPSPPSREEESKEGLPVIDVAEPAEALRLLLPFCLPKHYKSPSLQEIPNLARLVEAARKYEMEWLMDMAREVMKELARKEPIRVYAIACRFGFEDEAMLAARLTLRMPTSSILAFEAEELDQITANQFRRLVKYRDDCQTAVQKYLQSNQAANAFSSFDLGCGKYHNSAWKSRYVNKLLTILKDCVWEGAVRPEVATEVVMQHPAEMCQNCAPELQSRLTVISKLLASEVASTISKVPFVY